MTARSLSFILRAAELLSRQIPRLDDRELKQFVQSFVRRKDLFLEAMLREGSPLYVIDTRALTARATRFREAFGAVMPRLKMYYALKSNSHPLIASTLIEHGLGLDVSSGPELDLALDLGAKEIIFSGPGKRTDELRLAVRNTDKVTLLVDSFGELERLEQVAAEQAASIRVGVRLTTDEAGIWRKFGIPLDKLGDFFKTAEKCRWLSVSGLQFHLSWNLDPGSHVVFIASLATELRRLERHYRDRIEFLDIGGGYWPEEGEWLQSAATPRGMLQKALSDDAVVGRGRFKRAASPISDFADRIAGVLERQLPPDMKPTIYTEPGRWLCNDAMHILLTVTDRKTSDLVITDGGTNAVGWERFETDYFPVINLTRPSLHEHECLVAGSLCTPHDIWGYSYFGEDIREGDVLLVPNQGAYTYSLRQQFIKPLPATAELISTPPEERSEPTEKHKAISDRSA